MIACPTVPVVKMWTTALAARIGVIMKKGIITGSVTIILGLLLALGPQVLFKVCAHGSSFPLCHWSAQAEIGMGLLIAALGICLIVFPDPKTQQGLTIGIFLAGIIALSIPHALIGGCGATTMACRRIAFPVLRIVCIIILVGSVINMIHIEGKMKKDKDIPVKISPS
jgi:hypothetical protein